MNIKPNMLRKLGHESIRFIRENLVYRTNPLSTARRYWILYKHRRFSPDEIYFFSLLDPSLTDQQVDQVISKEELLTVQKKLNPYAFHSLTENKIRFYEHCLKAGLPVPKIFAIFCRGNADSFNFSATLLRDEKEIESYLYNSLPTNSIIMKPVSGVHGSGVKRLTRHNEIWKDNDGTTMDKHEFIKLIRKSNYKSWIFQEQIFGHPELCVVSGTEALQTVRVVTVVNHNNEVEILAARLRLICGKGIHDNFDYGRTGNLVANLDINDGTIRSVVGGKSKHLGINYVTNHPTTNKNLIGFHVPQWQLIQELASNAAIAFKPLCTIGWDIAITPNYPCLIEGNVTWDTLSGDSKMNAIYLYLKNLIVSDAHS